MDFHLYHQKNLKNILYHHLHSKEKKEKCILNLNYWERGKEINNIEVVAVGEMVLVA